MSINFKNTGKIITHLLLKVVSFLMIFLFFTHSNAYYINYIDYSISGDFEIENDTNITSSISVTLNMNLSGVSEMRFGNSETERDASSRETYSATKSWTLDTTEGKKTVYASFKNSSGDSVNISDDIIYSSTYADLPYSNNLTLWFDSSDSSNLELSSSEVTSWYDLSGNNYNASQSDTSSYPDYVTDDDIGESIIEFNGSSDYLAIEDYYMSSSSPIDGMLMCASFKNPTYYSSYSGNWSLLDFDRSEFFNIYAYQDGIGFSFDSGGSIYDNSAISGGYSNDEWHITCARYDGSLTNDTLIKIDGNTEVETNNTSLGSQIGDTGATRYGFIGEGSEASSYDGNRNNIYYDGSIGEILYYNTSVSDNDIEEIECYLGTKWGVDIAGCETSSTPIASISYSTESMTSGSVTATLNNSSETITITNNSGSDSYTFTENGSFTFTYEDSDGNTGSTTAQVDWIMDLSDLSNHSPEISSHSGQSNISLNVGETSTYVTTVTSDDDSYNIVGSYGKIGLSGNTRETIEHFEMCSPVTVVSHRGDVDGEIQRAPRITNKSSTSFDVKVDNYDSSIGTLETDIDYIVMNAGNYNFNGLQIQAGTENTSTVACNDTKGPTYTTSVSFSPNFSSDPVVLHTVSTENDSSWVISGANGFDGTRQSEPTTSLMGLTLQRSFNDCSHEAEDIDYIAFEPGHYTTDNGIELDAVRSSDSVGSITTTGDPISYNSSFSDTPGVALVSQLGEDGGNGSYAQIHTGGGILTDMLYATLDEDGPSADRTHTDEIVSAVAFAGNNGYFTEDNTITYSISGDDSSYFNIDSTSGELNFNSTMSIDSALDSDGDNIYEVTVSACDSHCNSQCSTQSFSVEVIDNISPTISGSNFSDDYILPGGNHDFEFYLTDESSGIDTTSDSIILEKWDGSDWSSDIASTYLTSSINTTTAIYTSTNLDYGKYRLSFEISDNYGNISSTYELNFYVDSPSLEISSGEVNLGTVNYLSNTYGELSVTVKTIGAGFSLKLKENQDLEDINGSNIGYYDGTTGFGYDKDLDGGLDNISSNETLATEIGSINSSGELNTYTYTVRLGSIIEQQQQAGDYSGKVDFEIVYDYN